VDRLTVRPEQWHLWARNFLPADEPFFLTDADTAALSDAGELVYTRAELTDSFPRFRVDYGMAYRMGVVDADSFVWLADRDARGRIEPALWVAVRDGQGTNGRGQVYDGSCPCPRSRYPTRTGSPPGAGCSPRTPGGGWARTRGGRGCASGSPAAWPTTS